MRPGSDALKRVLTKSHTRRLIVDSIYGQARKQDLPPVNWDLGWDLDTQIQGDGSVTIAYNSVAGESMTPEEFTDALAPFGQELNLLMEISAAGFSETIPLGRFRITKIPSARDEYFNHLGSVVTLGSQVDVEFQDRLIAVKRRGFRSEEAPQLTSCWAEMARISGMQISRNLPDQTVPAGLIYKAADGGRLAGVEALADALGGVPYVTYDGALSVIPNAWGPVVAELSLGDEGTVTDVGYELDSDGVKNVVVGTFEDDRRNPIYSVQALPSGHPLAPDGPYGEYTHFYSHDAPVDQAEADRITAAVLTQVSDRSSYRVPVQCLVNPLLEQGDVVTVPKPKGGTLTGRIMKLKHGTAATMSLELNVRRDVS